MLTNKERLLAISIGVFGGVLTDLALKPFAFSKTTEHLIGSSIVYFFLTLYLIFEFVKEENQGYFSKLTFVWILSDLLVIGIRWYLFYLGIVPSLTCIPNILLWIAAVAITCVIAVSVQAVLKIGDFAEENTPKKSPRKIRKV